MKKIIIAVFIIVSVIGIAAGTTKKAPSKTSAAPKKEIVDPYVGWWYHENENFGNILSYITKENDKYYSRNYEVYEKEKGQVFCKMYMGRDNNEITKDEIKEAGLRRATKEQVETLKYNIKYMKGWMKEPCGE